MSSRSAPQLVEVIRQQLGLQLSPPRWQWFTKAIDTMTESDSPLTTWEQASTSAIHHIGKAPFSAKLALPTTTVLSAPKKPQAWTPQHWHCTDAVRILLCHAAQQAAGCEEDKQGDTLLAGYKRGDENERAALIKGLQLLDPKGKNAALAIEACRINSLNLFTAIALFNPYPAIFFSQDAFNQLVIKSLFQGLNISFIYGLEARRNHNLSIMALRYVEERLDANRPVPDSIWLAIDCLNMTERCQRLFDSIIGDDTHHALMTAKQALQQSQCEQQCRDETFEASH
ncbi:EboA domain-containing protein [Corallincola spongiicola]|uniref:Uncharacterized protein n=1 Tax=Corallincola spongiicola TaxID=2520508 RepID=A0ABY1WRY4_9GAMM|nr:EboA domain-containing protein [Corallincola spongiicola]TAA47505.1 hypothetical protein EXY25_09805 [Corallincola spongiicola]